MAAILARNVLHSSNPQIKPTIIKQRKSDNDKSRILYLEKTIERLQRDHAESIRDLHSEISRLTTVCSEMMLKIAFDTSKSQPSDPLKDNTSQELEATPLKITTPMPISLQNSLATFVQNSFPDLPSRWVSTAILDQNGAHINRIDKASSVDSKETMTETQDNTSDPIYILVQKEKRKYQQMVEKVVEDKKKKSAEIDHLKVEIDLMKRVMKLAGVSVEMKDLHAILRNSAILTSKTSVLPPIPKEHKKVHIEKKKEGASAIQKKESKEQYRICEPQVQKDKLISEPEILIPLNVIVDDSKIHEIETVVHENHLEIENHLDMDYEKRSISPTTNATYKDSASVVDGAISHSQPLVFRKDVVSGGIINLEDESIELNSNEINHGETLHDLFSDGLTTISPPKEPKKASSFRSTRYKLKSDPNEIPAILTHNQNLDYNNRAHLFLDSYSYVESDASSSTKVPQIGNKRREKTLPPVIDRKGVLDLAKESFKNAKTTYSGRFWRAKIVKDKQMKDLHEKTI
ncbi:hypothetical protein HDV06_006066 [Boothiomyces sp. JEL0866]|nr:hypothetical protein HDV06_006016 [Boothiomyces sp. JEL0866]KAJ3324808.1 hypothetical protein HDV06_006066 [Boothiomyces sp. JEL0866]